MAPVMARGMPRLLLLALVVAREACGEEVAYVDEVMNYCYQHLVADASCCKDKQLSPGVLGTDVLRQGVAWNCVNPPHGFCLDGKTGPRGKDRLWWTEGADCAAPRILYVHGGNWTHHGPAQSSYDVLASKIAKVTNAVVLVPDFRLVPVGNYSDIIMSLMAAWRWLGSHGPNAIDCSAAPAVPQFVGGDSSGGATALSLLMELHRGAAAGRQGLGPSVAGLFAYSAWTNLASDTPTYYSEAFARLPDGREMDYIGDILHPDVPRSKSRSFSELGSAYVGSSALLKDPVASPFHAGEEQLRGLPPMYFAVSGTESMAGDSVVIAAKAAGFGVPVAVDIFEGLWHVFPQYSDGCGSGEALWQGMAALMHTGDFVRQIFSAAKNHPGRGFFVPDGASPQTEFYYPHPTGHQPWVQILPLTLIMGAVVADPDDSIPASDLLGAPADGSSGHDDTEGAQGASSLVPLRQLQDAMQGSSGVGAGTGTARCQGTTLARSFLSGAFGGALCMVLGLACAWVYTSRKHGLCMRISSQEDGGLESRSMVTSSGQEQSLTSAKARYHRLPLASERAEDSAMSSRASASTSRGIPAPFWLRPGTAVRREIRSMPAAEQERFAKALQRVMMNNRFGKPQTSEYFQIASSHAWPSHNGQYGAETFPSWNRGHLVQFERALVRADKELGNNGALGLPYWDWGRPSINGEVLPRILRQQFHPMPDCLVDPDRVGLLATVGYSRVHTEQQALHLFEAARVSEEIEQALAMDVHWLLSSRRWHGRGFSLESVHDSALLACGYPLSDPEYAAFHPLFFLLRCNVDRLYELHLQMFDHAESSRDMEQHQKQLHDIEGESDRFQAPLEPLMHPFERRKLMPADTFSTQELGYVYDELPPEPLAAQVGSGARREERVHAVFRNVDTRSLKGKSYMLHVFVPPRALDDTWRPPPGVPETWHEDPSYAGCHAVIGRYSPGSLGSQKPSTIDVLVEVQRALVRQKLGRHDAGVHVMCVDQLGEVCSREETQLPAPVLVGPLFEDPNSVLQPGSSSGEVQQLQGRLSRLGYGQPEMDGTFGPRTEEAVRQFQKFNRLKEDGLVGRATKQQLMRQRFTLLPDIPTSATPRRRLTSGGSFRYLVHTLPHNLERKREKALAEVSQAFSHWGEALQVKFVRVESKWRADVSVRFTDLSSQGADFHGGLAVRGGQLSDVADGTITLDSGEYWLLQGEDMPLRRPHAVRLYPVMLHAIGHLVGLPHSSSEQDVMWPYYQREDATPVLSPNDITCARELVAEGGCQQQ